MTRDSVRQELDVSCDAPHTFAGKLHTRSASICSAKDKLNQVQTTAGTTLDIKVASRHRLVSRGNPSQHLLTVAGVPVATPETVRRQGVPPNLYLAHSSYA